MFNYYFMKIKPVMMAGGQGRRLWPLSRQAIPKQLIKLFGTQSLLQRAMKVNASLGRATLIIAKQYQQLVECQLGRLNHQVDFIIEPIGKDTASCTIMAAMQAKSQGYEAMILLPTDHDIEDIDGYNATIAQAINYVSIWGICLIGTKPRLASPEYGYIKTEQLLAKGVYKAERFIEKPILPKAEDYLQQSNYFWNLGIYIVNIDFILAQCQIWQKDLFNQVEKAFHCAIVDSNKLIIALEDYQCIVPISLDYAVIEKIPQMIMIEAGFKWYDLGNYSSLWEACEKDASNNYCEGDVINIETTNSYIKTSGKLTVVIGVDDLVVVNSDDALLIVHKAKIAKMNQLMTIMSKNKRPEL